MSKKLETTKRRFDWVTALGMALFVIIVASEIGVAVGVPLLVRQEGVMAAKVVKLTTLDSFDSTRQYAAAVLKEAKSDIIRSQIKVVDDALNVLAVYMRENVDYMSTAQFHMVFERTQKLRAILGRLGGGTSYVPRSEISTRDALGSLAAPKAE